jgi:cytochrome c oxidase assembly protein subunit 15
MTFTNETTLDNDFPTARTYRKGPHWFALAATVFTWPLLFVGGLVTTYKVGMAVPDWPSTFGMNMFLYNFFQAPWGVFGEHTHRLYGAAVGLFTLLLMVDFLAFDRRGWMKGLGVAALAAVIVQGLLGGLRVTQNSTLLAAFHGCFGQAFFGLMVALCVMTGRGWFDKPRVVENARKFRGLTASGLGLIYTQVILGAWLRHFSDPRALVIHAVVAVLVFGHLTGLVLKVERNKAEVPELVPASRVLGLTLILQIGLGIGAWLLLRPYDGVSRPVTLFAALIRTGHQANAALLLASAVVLTLRAFGQLVGSPDWSRSSLQAPRDLEAVA